MEFSKNKINSGKKTKLNVLLIQYCPEPKQTQKNIEHVSKMLEKYNETHLVDIVVFPEMTFSGYIFDNKEDIKTCLEESGKGKTFDFCSSLAKRYL